SSRRACSCSCCSSTGPTDRYCWITPAFWLPRSSRSCSAPCGFARSSTSTSEPGEQAMIESQMLTWVAFLACSSLVLLLFLLVGGRRTRFDERLRELSGKAELGASQEVAQLAQATLPKMGAALLPSNEDERTRLQVRLTHAGLYSRQAMAVFL